MQDCKAIVAATTHIEAYHISKNSCNYSAINEKGLNRVPFNVGKIGISSNKPQSENEALIRASVAGVEILFFIDSGAQVNTITKNSFDLILSNPENIYNLKYATDKPLKAYASSSNIEVIATFSAILFISDDRPVSMEKFYVVNEIRSLLGFNTASRYSVLAVGLNVPIRDTGDLAWPCELYAPYIRSVSSEKFPIFNIAPVRLHYNKEIAPARNIFTHIPPAFKDRTKHMLQELLSSGITDEFMDCLFCYAFLAISVVIIHSCFITQVLLKK